jgi:hypothetical protein
LITSQTGDVFPEFAFSYEKPENCPEWSEDAKYSLGDYVKLDGKIFKATLPSGKSTLLRPNKNKQITIGAVKPQDAWKTWHHFEYNDGLKDKVVVWRRLDFSAFLMREDFPLSVDNLKIDIRIKNNDGMVRRIPFGSLYVNRSNMTFNNLEINVTQREAACQQLLCVRVCVNLEFNRCRFSGATYPGLGYNILNRNCALVKYTDCISVESRKGMDGRHGKNIHVTGGLYNKIADHYGRNLVIENAYFTGRVAYVPGRLKFSERLEMKDLAFRETHALGFAGANLRVENCTFNGDGGVFWVRDDMKNFYGNIIFKNIRVNCDKDVNLFTHRGGWHNNPRLPEKILIENASANPGKLNLYIGKGFKQYDSSTNIINCRNIGYVFSSGKSVYFRGCEFDDCTFKGYSKSLFGFWNCLFKGKAKAEGLKKRNIISDSGNISESGKPGLPLYSASEK